MMTRRVTMVLSMTIYIASMFLPLLPPGLGFMGLITVSFVFVPGFFTLNDAFGPLLFLSWFANPAFWLGFYRLIVDQPGKSARAAGVAFLIGLIAMPIVWRESQQSPAYWTWLASMLTLMIGSLAYLVEKTDPRLDGTVAGSAGSLEPVDDRITASPGPRSTP